MGTRWVAPLRTSSEAVLLEKVPPFRVGVDLVTHMPPPCSEGGAGRRRATEGVKREGERGTRARYVRASGADIESAESDEPASWAGARRLMALGGDGAWRVSADVAGCVCLGVGVGCR